ncbi:hypothetical protein KY331_05940 [Candidatus Woesearchaeota archaeon]|nr:hypothetical protein [Candidatus Woesearchaeota archaeon]
MKIKPVFYTMISIFVVLVLFIFFSPDDLKRPLFPIAGIFALVFFILGIVLIVLAARMKKSRLKIYLLLTGISAAGIPACVILHNLVYALFMVMFGEGFWGEAGDEPVFFIIGVLVFPILFIVGAVRSLILFKKKK